MKQPTKKAKSSAPKVIGEYRLIKKLDAGGMGVVFKAIKRGTNKEVALKALPPKFARNAERLTRFRREVLACSRLNHPNLIRVIEQGEHRGIHYFTMEYFPGLSLKKMLKRDGPFSPERVIRVARQIASACAFYHAKRLVHRDIKPANILMNDNGHVKIIDFGLAKVRDLSSMTRVDQALGTARYLAPEILLGRPVDRRSDIYQVGLVLHELLTGEPVFPGKEPMAAVRAFVFNKKPLEQINFKVPQPQWAQLLHNCLRLEPDARYDDADALAVDLEHIAHGEPVSPLGPHRAQSRPAPETTAPQNAETAALKPSPGKRSGDVPTRKSRPREKTRRRPAPTGAKSQKLGTRRRSFLVPLAIVGLLTALAAVAYYTRPVRIENLLFAPGIEDVTITWQTNVATTTALECSPADRNDFERLDRPSARRSHQVFISGLDPGREYRIHVIVPGGTRSPAYTFATKKPVFSDIEFQRLGHGAPRVAFRTSPALICEVEYRTATGMSKVYTGYEPQERHVTRLPSFDFKSPENNRLRIWYRQHPKSGTHRTWITIPR